MIEIGVSTRYRVSGTLSIALLFISSFLPVVASAQPLCNQIRQRIYQITSTEVAQVPDSLRVVLALTDSVRVCEGEVTAEREAWLMTAEVYAHDKLSQYAEAFTVVGQFFDVYFDEASDYYKARFYLWRLHLNALSGDGISMVKDYAEAQKYAVALDRINLAWLHINGAHAYMQIAEYQAALRLTEEALLLIGTPETYDERMAAARTLLLSAETKLHLEIQLPDAEQQLRTASRFYGELGDTSEVALATTLLGMTYAASDDTSQALAELSKGVRLAWQGGSVRSRVVTLFRQGQVLHEWGRLDAAEASLLQALDASDSFREFYLEIAYELACMYEERDELERAARYYQVVVDAPKPSSFVAALEAMQKAQKAQIRLLLFANDRNRTRFHFALSALFIVLAGGLVLFLFRRQHGPALSTQPPIQPTGLAIAEKKSNGDFIPRKLPTGLTLDELEQRFREAVGSKKLGYRLAWIYAVLLDIELILSYITDEYLARKVEAYNVGKNAELFKCVAAIEEARTEEAFTGRPENTLASYLRPEFTKRGWLWPKHPVVWKLHFIEYHVEMLFKKEEGDSEAAAED